MNTIINSLETFIYIVHFFDTYKLSTVISYICFLDFNKELDNIICYILNCKIVDND